MSRFGRLVIDTSTLVGALLGPQSVPRQAFMLALQHFDVCVSDATLAEAETVLMRRKFDRYSPAEDRQEFLAMFRQRSLRIDVDDASEVAAHDACRDPGDAKFLALAHASSAEVLISSDQDLLVLDGWQGVAIQTPAAFVEAMVQAGA